MLILIANRSLKCNHHIMENHLTAPAENKTDKCQQDQDLLQLKLEKAVAQQKFEIAANVLHDIGNAVVGFGSYLTRIKRTLAENDPSNLQNLTAFFQTQ